MKTVSREWELDCIIREKIGKIVRGDATEKDQAELQDAQDERVRRMMPAALERLQKRRAARLCQPHHA